MQDGTRARPPPRGLQSPAGWSGNRLRFEHRFPLIQAPAFTTAQRQNRCLSIDGVHFKVINPLTTFTKRPCGEATVSHAAAAAAAEAVAQDDNARMERERTSQRLKAG